MKDYKVKVTKRGRPLALIRKIITVNQDKSTKNLMSTWLLEADFIYPINGRQKPKQIIICHTNKGL